MTGPWLYLRELDQLGTSARLVNYLRRSPFVGVYFHANAEARSKTVRWAAAVLAAGFEVGVYTTPGGMTPDNYRTAIPALRRLAAVIGARRLRLDMEAPWKAADAPVEAAIALAQEGYTGRVEVTTTPGHPQLKRMAKADLLAVQVYDRFNRYTREHVARLYLNACRRAGIGRLGVDLPAWNKTSARLRRHLMALPGIPHDSTYWLADNKGTDDLPSPDHLAVIAECDPGLRQARLDDTPPRM